jgi:hypothetical protein
MLPFFPECHARCEENFHKTVVKGSSDWDKLSPMKKIILFTGLVAFGLIGLVWAQSEQEYSGWMKDLAATNGKIRNEVQAKDNAAVASDAAHVHEIFMNVRGFWEKRNASDAVKFASEGASAAQDLEAAAKASDSEKMASSLKSMGAVCGNCHTAHRERGANGFVIK